MTTGPEPGYYADPSIPDYIRYWDGAQWVPGTSRPAGADQAPQTAPEPTGDGQSRRYAAHRDPAQRGREQQNPSRRAQPPERDRGQVSDAATTVFPTISPGVFEDRPPGEIPITQQIPVVREPEVPQPARRAEDPPEDFVPNQAAPGPMPAQFAQPGGPAAQQYPAPPEPDTPQQFAPRPQAPPFPQAPQPQPPHYPAPQSHAVQSQGIQSQGIASRGPAPHPSQFPQFPQFSGPQSPGPQFPPSALPQSAPSPFAAIPGFGAPQGAEPESGEVRVVELASPGSRVLARIIDLGIVVLASAPVTVTLLLLAHRHDHLYVQHLRMLAKTSYRTLGMDATGIALWAAALLVLLAGSVGHEGYRLGRTGQTAGRRLCGVRVVAAGTVEPVSGGAATTRALLFWILALIPLVDLLALGGIFWGRPYAQGWHEKTTRTISIKN